MLSTEFRNHAQNLQVGEHIAKCDHNLIWGEIIIAKELEEINEQVYNYRRDNYIQISDKLRRTDKTASDINDTFIHEI